MTKKMKPIMAWAMVRREDGKMVDGPDKDKQHVKYGWPDDEYRIARVRITEVTR